MDDSALGVLERQSLDQLNGEIRRCLTGYATAAGTRRKEFFRKLVWAEGMREKLHGVAAPRRARG